MLKIMVNLFAGALFGLGLAVSGMVDPAKIIGFLDFHRAWIPEFQKAMNGAATVEQAISDMTRASNAALAQAAR